MMRFFDTLAQKFSNMVLGRTGIVSRKGLLGIRASLWLGTIPGFLVILGNGADAAPFIRGDVDENGVLEITDAEQTFGFLFLGSPRSLPCEDAADTNDDGAIDISDGIYTLTFLFVGGDRPPPPFPSAGFDRSVDDPFSCGDVIGGPQRPVSVYVPPGYQDNVPVPLVLLLHGFRSTGAGVEGLMRFRPLAASRTFLYAIPEGTRQSEGGGCWNAQECCANCEDGSIDDSDYLRRVIDGVKSHYAVDPTRVFVVGSSQGGAMAYRMACDHADTVAAIVSRSSTTHYELDPERCRPDASVHVLEIHGTDDQTIEYNGGISDRPCSCRCRLMPDGLCYPGAVDVVEEWATFNGCSGVAEETEERLDLYSDLPGTETRITRYVAGCRPGGSSELWTVQSGRHGLAGLTPNGQSTNLAVNVVDWLLAHPKTSRFQGGAAPAPPGLEQCGEDPTGDDLGCANPPDCQ